MKKRSGLLNRSKPTPPLFPVTVSASPHLHHPDSTASIMWTVFAVLWLPAAWGVLAFGASALWVLLIALTTAVAAEGLINLFTRRLTLQDGSAAVTGLLVGMNMPPALPLYVPAVASLFAVWVVKWTFGGLGKNWANPAIGGRVFVFLSYPRAMTTWELPSFPWQGGRFFADAATGATVLSQLKSGTVSPSTISPVADAFLGLIPGSIGEISALLLLVAAGILFLRRIITWEIPVAFIGTFALLVWLFGGLIRGTGGWFTGQVALQLCTGGLLLGALFMATDMVTSPATRLGQLIFGFGCGLLTFLVRFLGNFPEGVSLAILFMNILSPLLDRFINPKPFGAPKPTKKSLFPPPKTGVQP